MGFLVVGLLADSAQARTGSYPDHNFSPSEQGFLCPQKVSTCPEGSTPRVLDANAVEDDNLFQGMILSNKGCGSGTTNVGCLNFMGVPDVITVCCKSPTPPVVGSTPAPTASPSSATESCKIGLSPAGANGICIEPSDNYTEARCMNLRDVATNPLPGGRAEVTCPGTPVKKCCLQDPAWNAPAAPTPSGTTTPKPPTEYKLANPLGTTSIPVILGRIIRTFLGIVGAIALAVFVYGGVMWMTARGDQSQVKKGQDALKSAVIGLFIIMFSYALTGNFIKFWTAEERDIAADEGRSAGEEAPTQAGNDLSTIRSEAEGEQGEAAAGQAAAEEAGQEAGVAPTPLVGKCNNPNFTPEQWEECMDNYGGTDWLGSQSTINNDEPSGFGQPNACQPGDPNCSSVGWKTVCNQTVFDTGYGTYNKVQCLPYEQCKSGTILSSNCTVLENMISQHLNNMPLVNFQCSSLPGVQGFGLNCGSGGACCEPQ